MTEDAVYIDAPEVARILSLPVNTVYDYAARGIGPTSFKIGRHRRWDRRDVFAWIEAQKAAATRD